jgi:CHAT domain-containing protein
MLLVADPVYEASDSRLASAMRPESAAKPAQVPAMFLVRGSDGSGSLPRLPATAEEAATIAALLPKDRVDRLEGLAAARDRFLAAGLERYRFIHVASHAVNDVEIPQASALVLSTFDQRAQPADGRVLAADLVNVQLHAEAVVLSACDTALGKNVAGEGLMGLQYVVLARGAESVVSSLWPVIDQASAQLMSQFYRSRLRAHAALPAALGDAMRGMLTGRFKDPGVWGAFTVTVAHAGSP